jgi:hypothetical protein
MLCFVERTSRKFDEAPIIVEAASAGAFSDVCADAVSRANDLLADSMFSEVIPFTNYMPDCIGKAFS